MEAAMLACRGEHSCRPCHLCHLCHLLLRRVLLLTASGQRWVRRCQLIIVQVSTDGGRSCYKPRAPQGGACALEL